MAKVEYVVVSGCIQNGSQVVREGDVFVPPSIALRDALLAEGVIAAGGKLEQGGRGPRRQSGAGGPVPNPEGGSGEGDDDGDPDEDSDEGD
ncbi:hypothetical protein ACE1YR_00730 [Pseudomonas sp. K1(2024)]|uniref:Uncharacterized protein n=1 Tax=Pseudomonas boreofloridensis TaxID=3064348 RepID=A0ABV4Z3R7_9PSED|nr:hypothetical protein [Pseudomonas sp. K13]MDO7900629.1 hypothetical protein [Pseudomonas sp. K13]